MGAPGSPARAAREPGDGAAREPSARERLLLERDAEVAAMDLAVTATAAGEGRMLVVEGPAGIGKSRLLARARTQAQAAGLLTCSARGSELEQAFPFGVVRQLLEQQVATGGAALMDGVAAGAHPVFAPPGEGAGEGASPGGRGDASFAVLHGLYWLCVNLSALRPLALVVDDLHWCDRPSLRFLAYLARRLEGVEMLVAMTLRSADPGTDPALLAEIAHDPLTSAIQPRPLTAAAVAAMVRERFGAEAVEAFCAACLETTGGNPLLLE